MFLAKNIKSNISLKTPIARGLDCLLVLDKLLYISDGSFPAGIVPSGAH